MNIEGMTAIVTGAGSGLGEATARALAQKGAQVGVLDLNGERAQLVAQEIGGIAATCDVADESSCAAAIDHVAARFGAARILVNCAGIVVVRRTLTRDGAHPLDEFERVLRVNLLGTFNMIRLATRHMRDLEPLAGGERGVVVNSSSIAAFDGQVGQAAYAASKGGVAAMTLPVARDLASSGIRVVSIAPGPFRTAMVASLPDEAVASLGKQVPFPPRLGEPAEFAALAMHIVENQMLNGETIRLDGALRMAPK